MAKAYAPITSLIINTIDDSIDMLLYPRGANSQSISGKNLNKLRDLQILKRDLSDSNLKMTVDIISNPGIYNFTLCPCPKDCGTGTPICCPCNSKVSQIDGFIYDPMAGKIELYDCNGAIIHGNPQLVGQYHLINIPPNLTFTDICSFKVGASTYNLKQANKNIPQALLKRLNGSLTKPSVRIIS